QHQGEVSGLERQAQRVEVASELRQKILPAPRLGELELVLGDPGDARMDRADQRDELGLRKFLAQAWQRAPPRRATLGLALRQVLGEQHMGGIIRRLCRRKEAVGSGVHLHGHSPGVMTRDTIYPRRCSVTESLSAGPSVVLVQPSTDLRENRL